MARIRTVKPELFTNDRLADCSLAARYLYIGLFCLADRRGRLENRPKRIKIELLPYDDADVSALISELANGGYLTLYAADVGGELRDLIQINGFEKHQRITGKEAAVESQFPAPQENAPSEAKGKQQGNTQETPRCVPDAQEGKGKERKGIDTPAPASPIPDASTSQPSQKKPKEEPDPLKDKIRESIQARNLKPDGTPVPMNWPKEAQGLKRLLVFIRSRASPQDEMAFTRELFQTFDRLRDSGDKFWAHQPFTASVLGSEGIFPRVVQEMELAAGNGLQKQDFMAELDRVLEAKHDASDSKKLLIAAS